MSQPIAWHVGQQVAYNADYGRGVVLGTVTRLTATQVLAKFGDGAERRFRTDGYEVGKVQRWSGRIKIRPSAEADHARIKHLHQSSEARRMLAAMENSLRQKHAVDLDALLAHLNAALELFEKPEAPK